MVVRPAAGTLRATAPGRRASALGEGHNDDLLPADLDLSCPG
ncbi:hypothetical protein [Frankia umida]|nr:hypothetical protein [Frankia umida]